MYGPHSETRNTVREWVRSERKEHFTSEDQRGSTQRHLSECVTYVSVVTLKEEGGVSEDKTRLGRRVIIHLLLILFVKPLGSDY